MAPVSPYAGFWLRFVAYIIDGLALGVVGGIIGVFVGIGLGASMANGDPSAMIAALGPIYLFAIVGGWLYFALCESSSWQATLGKKAMGLTVTDMNGRRISFGKATGRFFGKIISGMILYIGFIMAGFTEKKQALHDMLAGTLVMKRVG
ncbi:MAG: RDD family protein [Candidatus Acidiferrales bacterium]